MGGNAPRKSIRFRISEDGSLERKDGDRWVSQNEVEREFKRMLDAFDVDASSELKETLFARFLDWAGTMTRGAAEAEVKAALRRFVHMLLEVMSTSW